jgi:hypothetical protein
MENIIKNQDTKNQKTVPIKAITRYAVRIEDFLNPLIKIMITIGKRKKPSVIRFFIKLLV